MNIAFLLLIFATGAAGIAAQVLLLRELLVSFNGNELSIGIILSAWVIAEAAGAFFGGRLKLSRLYLFILLQAIFFLCLFAALYLSREFKSMLGLGFGEAAGLGVVLFSFVIVALPAFLHGALFCIGSDLFARMAGGIRRSIARVYAWETFGTLAGGIALSYLFIPWIDPFQSVYILSVVVFSICLITVVIEKRARFFAGTAYYAVPTLLIFLSYAFFGGSIVDILQKDSLSKQWQGFELLESRNSIYGNTSVTKRAGQYTFYYNGLPQVTAPNPDRQFVSDFGNFPLLFHPSPKEILVIGSGAGGLLKEILRYDITRLDYAEIDPQVIRQIQRFPTELTTEELGDKRVRVINRDGRYHLHMTDMRYDIILIGLSEPADLAANRLFTTEFYTLAKMRLARGGIIAFWLPWQESYMGRQQAGINSAVSAAFKQHYRYVRVIPGDYYAIFLGSDSADLGSLTAKELLERLNIRAIDNSLLSAGYIEYLTGNVREARFLELFSRNTSGINSDRRPIVVYEMFLYNSKKFFGAPLRLVSFLEELNPVTACLLVLVPFLMVPAINFGRRRPLLPVFYSIATTGFFGMLSSLSLMFIFQAWYGYVFQVISLFIAVFMAGAGVGSLAGARPDSLVHIRLVFLRIEAALIFLSFGLASFFMAHAMPVWIIFAGFCLLFALCGFLVGMQFPLAAAMVSRDDAGAGRVTGALYSADLAGGCIAGALGGIVLVPVAGLFNTCLLMALLKFSSLMWLVSTKYKKIA